jgi:predicted nucleic-acid-binding protein
MEIIFQRNKAFSCLETMQTADKIFTSSLSVHICMYYLEKDSPDLIADFQEILGEIFILDLNSNILSQAFKNYDFEDYEDCLQIETCLSGKITNFLTLDKKLAKNHKNLLNIVLL